MGWHGTKLVRRKLIVAHQLGVTKKNSQRTLKRAQCTGVVQNKMANLIMLIRSTILG
jgi:hypothetical protein